MDFKTRRLRKEPRKPKQKISVKPTRPSHSGTFKEPKKKNYNLQMATLGGGIVVILVLIFGIYQVISSMDFSAIVFSFGKTLQTDETGKTNIMLVGTGGAYHDGGNLTDTIIVASIDYRNNIVPMLSIPRDFYVISDKLVNQRINSVYYNAAIQYGDKEGIYILRDIVSDITGLPIPTIHTIQREKPSILRLLRSMPDSRI
jgi:anionic cell wall polymer biosynthesis LytR-Cps2A-Psr (LCP) family protein